MKGFGLVLFVFAGALKTFSQTYCIPQTLSACCGYGIVGVSLPGINQVSADASVGYEDFSGLLSVNTEGDPIPVTIETGGSEPHDVRIWLDANNDGQFEHPSELVFEALGANGPSGYLTLPATTQFNTGLRLRIMADFVGSDPLPCGNPSFGQTEDYTLKLLNAGQAPTAGFAAGQVYTCNGVVQFENTSTGNPSSFLWDFGDGNISDASSPYHQYAADGLYDVSLTVSNSLGTDTELRNAYIQVSLSETCDTFLVPATGTANILYTCNYVLMDNGRNGNYSDNTNGLLSLSTLGAEKICIHFSHFHFEQEFDYVELYDGPSAASPLIGKYSGDQLPPDICSSGPALAIRQVSDDIVNYEGFVAQVLCTMDMQENEPVALSVYPNPFSETFTLSLPVEIDNGRLEILSLAGKTVYASSFSGQDKSISTEGLPKGIYLLRIWTAKGFWQCKLSKNG